MPPKANKTKKKKMLLSLDGVNTYEMSLKNLQDYCVRINEELQEEKEKTKFFQLERDKLKTSWDLALEELHSIRTNIRRADTVIEIEARHHGMNLKSFQNRVKNVYCEKNVEIAREKLLGMSSLLVKETEYVEQGEGIFDDVNKLQSKITEMEIIHTDAMKMEEIKHAADVVDVRSQAERNKFQMEVKYEKFVNDARESVENENESDLLTLTHRKQKEVENIVNNFKKKTHVLTHYYKNMTRHNMSVISSMKERFLAIEKHCESRMKHFHKLEAANSIFKTFLNQIQVNVKTLCEKLIDYEEKKTKLREFKSLLPDILFQYSNRQWEKDIASFRLINLQNNSTTFTESLFDSNIKIVYDIERQQCLIESMIDVLLREFEKKDIILIQNYSCNINDCMKAEVSKNINDTLAMKASLIYELQILCRAHEKLICTYKEKLKSYNIHENEMAFVGLRVDHIHDKQGNLILHKSY